MDRLLLPRTEVSIANLLLSDAPDTRPLILASRLSGLLSPLPDESAGTVPLRLRASRSALLPVATLRP